MNRLYGTNAFKTPPLTISIAMSCLITLKTEYNIFNVVFKSGDSEEMVDCQMDELAWSEVVDCSPKVVKYKEEQRPYRCIPLL